jgi:hypothetical protein
MICNQHTAGIISRNVILFAKNPVNDVLIKLKNERAIEYPFAMKLGNQIMPLKIQSNLTSNELVISGWL